MDEAKIAYYQRKMEEFYDDLLKVWRSGPFEICADTCDEEEPYILHPDIELVLFEEVLYSYPDEPDFIHQLLKRVAEKGWKIILNFMEPECLLGNVAVKIGEKWFAFGQCRKDENGEPYVAEIWPLKYILPRINKMEITLKNTIPLDYLLITGEDIL